jgi:hypothetical protein
VAAVTVVGFGIKLVAGHVSLVGVDDDNVVTTVDVFGKHGLAFAC